MAHGALIPSNLYVMPPASASVSYVPSIVPCVFHVAFRGVDGLESLWLYETPTSPVVDMTYDETKPWMIPLMIILSRIFKNGICRHEDCSLDLRDSSDSRPID
jgi:hypothetical protein